MIFTKVKSTCKALIRLHQDPKFTPSLLHHLFKCLHIFSFFFKHNPFPFCGKGNGHTCFRCCRPKTKADMENENKSDQPPHNIGTIVTQRNRLIAWLGPSQRFHLRLFHALAGYCNSMMGLIFVGSCGFVSRCNGTEERRTQPFIFCKIR